MRTLTNIARLSLVALFATACVSGSDIQKLQSQISDLILQVGDLALQLLDVRPAHARRREERDEREAGNVRECAHRLLSDDHEMTAAVLRPRALIVTRIERTLFAIA